MICLRNVVKWVLLLDFCEEVEQRFKQILLGADAVVSGEMVGDEVGEEDFVARDHIAILEDILLNSLTFVDRQYFTVQLIKLVHIFFFRNLLA